MGCQLNRATNHSFMWDAAVSELALSPNGAKDHSQIPHHYPNAMAATNKVTVLYNQNDPILAVPYWLASYFGVDVGGHLTSIAERFAGIYGINMVDRFRQSLMAEFPQAKDRMKGVLYDKDFDHLIVQWFEAYMLHPDDDKVRANMREIAPILHRYAIQFQCAQALGFVGVKEPYLINQLKDKLTLANLSKYATGHSYMKIPNPDVMKYGYKYYIINKTRGVKGFGSYDKSAFPDPKQG